MNKKRKKIVANVIIIVLILSGVAWIASLFIHLGGEYTNNAQVRRDIVVMSARVQGFIKKVNFDEFQHVKRGDTLVLIDDSEFRFRLAQAEADYRNALAGKSAMGTSISAVRNNMSVTDAGIDELHILLANAENDYRRYQNLLDKNAVTRQAFDAVKTQYESLKAKLETMQRQKQSTKLTVDEQEQRLAQNDAGISVSLAALNLANLNLSYTVVTAPCDGYVARKTIQAGELVMPGQRLFAVVSDEQKWVIANFRETQRRYIHVGSKVKITVDAYPDAPFEGVVAAISNATGAEYSPASPDNAAGNFVKVEQRIPVKILFSNSNNAEMLAKLSSGMNVECLVIN